MPAGESEARTKTKARFDEVLKRYTDAPAEKKKSKKKSVQPEESIALETLKKNLGLNKGAEDDETILKNTYQPDQSSPRYIKNRLREKELSEKVNNESEVPEGGKLSQGRKKGTRDLPVLSPEGDVSHSNTRADEDASRSTRVAVLKAVPEGEEARRRRAGNAKKEGKRKGKREDGAREREVEADDELLQEYQQQIAREEQRAGKPTSSKKPPARRSSLEQEVALNNDTERKKMKKKKKKLRSQETEGDAGSGLETQPEDASRKHLTKQVMVSSDTEREESREQAINEEEQTEKTKKRKTKEVIVARKNPLVRRNFGRSQTQTVIEDSEVENKEPPKPVFDDSLVLGVYVHRTDQLKTDLLVSHPMVKVHVIDEVTGKYAKKEDSHRPVSSFYEQEKVEHVLPIMTQPYDFKKNKSTIPEWEEQIIFNERFGYFLQDDNESPRVILFFEVLDFISMDEARANVVVDEHERGFRKIAWAFLKLVGTNGVLNVDSKLRLQLYCPPPRVKKQSHGVEVIEWWRKYPRSRYASTLYVTVKGLKLPEHVDPSVRSMTALQQERGTTLFGDPHNDVAQKSSTQLLEDQADIVKWSRVPGQVCRIPNKPMLSFRGGQMGCFMLRFSHAGRRLAAACTDRDAFPVVVYEIPSGKVLAAFNGHLSIVYDVCWSRDDQSLLSASSDGTVRIWNMERLRGVAKKVLPHPSFVYSAQFHPVGQNLVVTGGYDCLIRVWNINVQDVNGQLLHEFEGHKTFINALCFDAEGLRLFSADSAGLLIVWNMPVGDGSYQHPTRLWNIEREIMESDLKGIAINGLEVHPNGRRLLIHARDSVLRVMDLRILAVKKYTGATNYRERIRSTFSPCGSFIFSGSEDGMAYVWNAETGDQVAVYSELCYPTPVRNVAFHPHENMVAFCAFGESQPVHVYIYDRKVAQMEVGRLKGLNRSGTADRNTLRDVADLPGLMDPTPSALDRLASTTRITLKMQHVKQKLDSVLNSHQNPSALDFYEQGGVSAKGRKSLPESSLRFNALSSDLSFPAPSLLSPHSKLRASGPSLILHPPLATSTRGFSPVGQRLSQPLSQRLQTSFDRPSSSLHAEADSSIPVQQMVVLLYDYTANRSDELTVSRGDVIQVLYKDNESWWFGCLADGRQGYFPANYVVDQSDFEEDPNRAVESDSSVSDRLNQSAEKSPQAKLRPSRRSDPARPQEAVGISQHLHCPPHALIGPPADPWRCELTQRAEVQLRARPRPRSTSCPGSEEEEKDEEVCRSDGPVCHCRP
ncbi:jouberin isoform X2 [Brienomyrus brachyistius]|uniref:jouberin isoform X2 n=1 Tax=Brienomyrus brachyistius TaxID=42636 RepID=UPI0020B1A5E2|nr:jouberin isoform X2 [Brienomyrus brachyistius]